jgi:hypothetical protein
MSVGRRSSETGSSVGGVVVMAALWLEEESDEALSENQDDEEEDGLSSGDEDVAVMGLVSEEMLVAVVDEEDDDALLSALKRSKNFCSSGSKFSGCLGAAGGGCGADWASPTGVDGLDGDGDAQSQPMMTGLESVFVFVMSEMDGSCQASVTG